MFFFNGRRSMTKDEMVRCKVEGSFDLFAAPHKLDIVYLRLISVSLLLESSIPTLAILVLSIIRQCPCLFNASEVLDMLDGSFLFMTSTSLGGDTENSLDVKRNAFNNLWRTQQAICAQRKERFKLVLPIIPAKPRQRGKPLALSLKRGDPHNCSLCLSPSNPSDRPTSPVRSRSNIQ